MRVVSFRRPAPEGERFAEGCFDSQLGAVIPWTERDDDDAPGRPLGTATILDVWVDPDGLFAVIVAELAGPRADTIALADGSPL